LSASALVFFQLRSHSQFELFMCDGSKVPLHVRFVRSLA
jgi:hypothetical protein